MNIRIVSALFAVVLVAPFTAFAQFDDNGGYLGYSGGDTYDEYFTPSGSDTYDEYFTPSGSDTYDEYFTPSGSNTYDEYFTPNDHGTDITGTDITGMDIYGTDIVYENGVGYSYTPTFSAPTSFGSSQYFSAPHFSYPSTPIVFNAPSYIPPAPAPIVHPQPVVPAPTPSSNVNNNTNVNNNNINISNNSSAVAVATVAPVQAAPVQYQVQYVQPQVYAQPSCTITITNYNGNSYGPNAYSQLATITWTSANATSGYINPSIGNVSGWGTMQVYPQNGQVYSMTVYGQGGSATCSTQPYYVPVAPVVQNPTPYVSLSQIPYTGFDFGTLGNSIYWLSLVVFAGAAAYLVLYFNGGALATLSGNRSRRTQIAMPRITVTPLATAVAAKAEAPVISPIQLATSSKPSDKMHVSHSKAGEMPRIHISRE